jgi:hypothetical protein
MSGIQTAAVSRQRAARVRYGDSGSACAVHFSEDEGGEGSEDEEETWVTAATRERFGYRAWRVKRCLMKQGYHVSSTREDYGYKAWLVQASVEGTTTSKDRMNYQLPSAVNPINDRPGDSRKKGMHD